MVEIKELATGYGREKILNGVSLCAKSGEITTILGKNGCGKSTLLKAVVGMLPIIEGEILIDGCGVKTYSGTALAQKMAYLCQSRNTPDITVGRLVLHGRFPYLSYPRKYVNTDYAIASAVMKQMQMDHLADVPLSKLSGGLRQKAYIAMALAQQTSVIVMDEPSVYLDVGQQKMLCELLKNLAQQGKTVMLVLHDILLALQLSDQICVLEEGKCILQGTPNEIAASRILDTLYGIQIKSVDTVDGLQYYMK